MSDFEAELPGNDGEDNTGGLTTVYALPRKHVAVIPDVVGEVVAGDGGSVLITGNITVNDPINDGATLIYTSRDSQILNSPIGGEVDGRTTNHELNAFHPGLSAAKEAFKQKAKNHDWILFVSQCDGPVIMIGNDCEGAELLMDFSTGQKSTGRKGYSIRGLWDGPARIYQGVIPVT